MTRLTKIILSVFLMVEGVIFVFGLPPFQKFDETVHFGRTMALSQGQLFCKDGHFEIPTVWDNLKHDYRFQKVLLENEKFPIDTVGFSKKWTEEELTQNSEIGGCGLNLLGYVPNTIGVWATSWTNRPAIVFYGGRVAGFVFLVTMLLWSLRIIDKKFQYLIWFYGLLPMVVHQATSFSYDVVIVSLILPLTALLVNKIIRKRTGWADISFWLIVTVMAVIKIVYVPLILVYIVFGWSKIKMGKQRMQFVISNFLYLLLMGGVVLLMTRLGKSDSDSPLFINPGLQKIVLMKDPLYFVTVLATTWRQQWQSILVEMVGVFGWRNVQMTDSLAVYVFLVIVWLVIKRLMIDLKDKIKPVQALVSLAVLALVMVLICLAMYVVATTVGDRTINGVQGRYLLPLLPIGLIMVAVLVDWSKERELIKWLFFGLVLGGVLGSIGHSLWLRYYDFSMDWVNGPIDEQDLEMIEDGDFEVLEINKKVEVVAEAGGKSISGVVLKMRNNNRAVLIPYRYRIKDAKCEKTFRFGYLSVWGIQADNEYILSFKRVKADQNKLCLELEPIELDIKDYDNFLTMEAIDKQMKIEWLYF